MDNTEVSKYFAYRHINGRIMVRRFTFQDSLEDAYDSDFVDQILEPYEAKNRLDAEQIAVERLRKV